MSLLWFIAGYSLAFGEGNAVIGDFSKSFMAGIGRDTLSGDIPESLFMAFQMTFAVHYIGPDYRWLCRAYALFGHAAILNNLAVTGLRTRYTLGLGRRLAV